ncbi:MAG: dynamin family protein [Nitrospirae bacterium]|nr:dynamin family protein [Nitrospirota bacterium]
MINSNDQRDDFADAGDSGAYRGRHSPQHALLSHLRQAEQVLRDMGNGFAGFRERLAGLTARLDEGRFHLAVLGQFKRGKSSLLNALLGEPLLPTGVLPLTAVPTVLRYGPERRVQVTGHGGQLEDVRGTADKVAEVLRRYVTEEGNSANRLGVTQVVVEHPSPFLSKGVEIIDTPGIGSTFVHNTETTLKFLPQCDAALFVISADPPITEVEVEFLKVVKVKVARLIFVQNKMDYLSVTERQEANEFLRKVLRERLRLDGEVRIFELSARRALEARSDPAAGAGIENGGLRELESYLGDFLVTEKEAALREAIAMKASGLLSEALLALDLERKVLELPAADLERRVVLLEKRLAELDRERIYLIDRLTGDLGRTREYLDGLAAALQWQIQTRLHKVVVSVRAELGLATSGRETLKKIRQALADAVPALFDVAQADMTSAVDLFADELLQIHVEKTDGLINRIRQAAADLFEVPFQSVTIRDPFQVQREPLMVKQQVVTSFAVAALEWIEHLLPAPFRVKRFERRIVEDIKTLAARNVENLRWAIRQNMDQVFRMFQAQIETHITEATQAIRGAIEAAQERQRLRMNASGPEIARLADCRDRLAQVAWLLAPHDAVTDDRSLI